MDYQKLKQLVPKVPMKWTLKDTTLWLQFICFQALIPKFEQHCVDGSILHQMTENDFKQEMGVKSSITIRKLMQWVSRGFKQYQEYLNDAFSAPQEVITSQTTQKQILKAQQLSPNQSQRKQLETQFRSIKSKTTSQLPPTVDKINSQTKLQLLPLASNQASYIIWQKGAKIGSDDSNCVRIDSVQELHSQIIYKHNHFYIKDLGSKQGTFIRILDQIQVRNGMAFNIGSKTLKINQVQGTQVSFTLGDQQNQVHYKYDTKNNISIGRKPFNTICCHQDQKMSCTHIRIIAIDEEVFLEDVASKNGTWKRISPSFEQSEYYPLFSGDCIMIGKEQFKCVITPCKKVQPVNQQKCMLCRIKERNALLTPCEHVCVCLDCCQTKSMRCPMCYQKVEMCFRVSG